MRRPAPRLRDDEAAAIQVVEAILVAVLVAGALIFFALSNRPSAPVSAQATESTLSAADALAVLQGTDPGGPTDRLQTMVGQVLHGTATTTWRTNVTNVLPQGVHWSVRLFTGFGRIEVLNSTSNPLTPAREVAGAQAFVGLATGATGGNAPGGNDVVSLPGDALGFNLTASCSLTDPTGSPSGPGGVAWKTVWLDGASARATIPEYAMFGRWVVAAGCDGDAQAKEVFVGINEDFPATLMYTVELVVWNVY